MVVIDEPLPYGTLTVGGQPYGSGAAAVLSTFEVTFYLSEDTVPENTDVRLAVFVEVGPPAILSPQTHPVRLNATVVEQFCVLNVNVYLIAVVQSNESVPDPNDLNDKVVLSVYIACMGSKNTL